jgi:hypothetical protein
MTAASLDELFAENHSLPSVPKVVRDLIEVLSNDNATLSQVARKIDVDQVLTARMLRLANSPYYGVRRKISTMEEAIRMLGLSMEATSKSDKPDLEREIFRIFSRELEDELRNSRPTKLKIVRDVIVDLVASPIPFLSTGITGAKGIYELWGGRRSWIATFFKLTDK